MVTIEESGMVFGPFAEDHVFLIEKSTCYQKIQQGIPMAEFLLLRNNKQGQPIVLIVEAKSSSPRSEKPETFAAFIEEIRQKLSHAFLLGLATVLGRHPSTVLPEAFTQLNLSECNFRLMLVINGHKPEWLPPLQEALALALKPLVKTWALPPSSVSVINHVQAQQLRLVQQLIAPDSPAV